MLKENFELVGGVEISNDVEKRIKETGVRYLSTEVAKEKGVFQRIANLLCVMHASFMTANRVYGGVVYLVSMMHARKNEIAREMNLFEKAYERFLKFWTGYYAKGKAGKEVIHETENLYHRLMEWMQMPEQWDLGDPQRTDCGNDLAIRIDMPDDKIFTFYKAEMNHQIIGCEETWGVLCYDMENEKQVCVNSNMDKASALMVAKRLSNENPNNIYTASIVRDVMERRTEVTPFKAFKANETIGKVTSTSK